MKFKRLFIMSISALCLLTSCNISNSQKQESGDGKTRLNVMQSNLIAEFTGNKDYLNKDLLIDIKTLDDNDQVGVIVTLNDKGIMDSYMKDKKGCESLAEYHDKGYADFEEKRMELDQNRVIDRLHREGLIERPNHSYTTLLNGFSADTTYGNYKKLLKMGIASQVSLSEVYALPKTVSVETDSDVVENETGVHADTGIFDSSEAAAQGFTGANTAVAVLDSGFDVHHTVFKNMPTQPMISIEDVRAQLPSMAASSYDRKIQLKAEDVYLNSKIPFVYDYADKDEDVAPFESSHGTHVAGIIAGKDDRITGVATNTQLVLMKVFGDVSSGATDEDIIAALEDSVLLGVDAINLSLGTACGFTETNKTPLRNIYQKIEDEGISLIVAASNDYSSGYGGELGNTSMATNPDSAAVGSPSTFNSSLAVASIAGDKSKYIKSDDGFTFFFEEASGNGASNYDFYKMLGIPENKNTEIEYVTVPGVGKPANYQSINIKGKIALVKRGGISFEEKAQYAYEAGAKGVILYNNLGGEILMNAGSNLKIAYASISKDDGERLASKKKGTLIFNTEFKAGPFMSDFSSWGPSPDLKLKPEITAHGGEILSSVPGGGYDRISGTSMASPNMCGIVVLIRQYLKERYPSLEHDAKTLATLTNQILMSTATIANDKYGNPYSPRKQGAGLGSLTNALNTDAFIVVDGTNKTKIELYDDPKQTGVYELKFNIINISNKELRYELDNLTMTESLQSSDRRFIAERAYMLNPESSFTVTGDGNKNANVITVNPNGHVEVSYTLKLNKADMKYMKQGFKNGIYVEGFATLDNLDKSGVDLSVPFLAFFGDWTKAPMLDKTIFEVESEKYNAAIDEEDKIKADYYATQPLGTFYTDFIIPLGSYIYDLDKSIYTQIPTSEEHCAIGYSVENINGILTVYAGLLRNAKKVTTTIINSETGDVVYEHVNWDQLKAHFSGMQIPSFDMIDVKAFGLGLENNVKYTFKMHTELDYGDGGAANNERNDFEFSFYVDSQAPILKDAQFYTKYDKSKKENRYYVDLMIYDNHYAQSVRPYCLIDGKVTILSEYATPVFGDRNGTSKVTIEVTDYLDLLQYNQSSSENPADRLPMTNGLGFLIDDYALNTNYYYVSLPGTNATEIDFVDENGNSLEAINTRVGEELDLTKLLKTNDPTFNKDDKGAYEFLSHLKWESSDEDVFRVHNGKLEGVGVGTAELTVSAAINDGYIHHKTIDVRVSRGRDARVSLRSEATPVAKAPEPRKQFDNNVKLKSVDFTYFETKKAFPDGPKYSKIGRTGDFLTVTNMPMVEFFPSEQIQMNYEIKPWNLDPSRCEFIWQSSNDSIVKVDENGLITAMKEGTATVTLRVKVDGKLSNQMAKMRFVVHSEFIVEHRFLTGYKGWGGDVVIPDDEGILGIDSYAFSLYNLDVNIDVPEDDPDMNKLPGANLDITSVVVPSDVSEIGKYAFYGCENLERVVLLSKMNGDKLETAKIIRQYAFRGCKSLKEINLDKVEVIGFNAFEGCTSLETINLASAYSIGARAFMNCTSLLALDLTHLRNAGIETFKGCTALKSITTGEFTKYSEGMFEGCSSLESLDFYSDRIPAHAFKDCSSLKNVVIHNPIIYIGVGAFENTSGLESVLIKNKCDFIYDDAFKGSGLKKITLPNSDVKLDNNVFAGASNLSLVIFQSDTLITSSLKGLFDGNDKVEFDTANSKFYTYENLLLLNNSKNEIILASHKINGRFVIPAGIEKIRDAAFNSIPGLTELELADSLVVVGNYAFEGCTNLTRVSGSASNIDFGKGVFEGCSTLNKFDDLANMQTIAPAMFKGTGFTEVTLNATEVMAEAFRDTKKLATVNGKAETLGEMAFARATSLESVNLEGLANVGGYAFFGCSRLATINMDEIVNVGDYAFFANTMLRTLNLPKAVIIGNYAFANNPSLQGEVNLPKTEVIGRFAFSTTVEKSTVANYVTAYNVPSLRVIGDFAFKLNVKLASFETNGRIEEIGMFAFDGCNLLEVVSLPNSVVTELNMGVFKNTSKLHTITLPGIEVINGGWYEHIKEKNKFELENSTAPVAPAKMTEAGAFFKAASLNSFDFSEVRIIGDGAFLYCSSLLEANMPKVVEIGMSAFTGCKKLANVNMPVVEVIKEGALSEIAVEEIVIPSTIRSIDKLAFNNNKKQTRFVDVNGNDTVKVNDYLTLDHGVIYTRTGNGKLLMSSYPTNKKDTKYEVLNGTVRIEFGAASYNPYLEEVVLPETLKNVGNLAFYLANRLNKVEFRSQVAPTLEETILNLNQEIEYPKNTEIYEFLFKYLNQNGMRSLMYGNFNNLIGTIGKLSIVLPHKDVKCSGYDGEIYRLYFNLAKAENSQALTLDNATLIFLDLIDQVPTANVTLRDERIIYDARTAYNKVKNYINDYEQIDKDKLAKDLKNLEAQEAKVAELRQAKINSEYGELIEDIKNLGSEFNYDKIGEYKRILEMLELVRSDDKKYIDTTNFDSFKKAYEKYFDDLYEDITTMDTIVALPTSPVTFEGVAAGLSVLMALVNVCGLVVCKRWLI